MAVLDLYIDTARNLFVSGLTSPAIFDLPAFTQGDTVTMRIRCLAPTVNFPFSNPPFTALSTSGRTLQLAIGTQRGGTILTQQYTWTASTNPGDPYFSADVPFNTANINAALISVNSIQSLMQINLIEGTTRTVFFGAVNIQAAVIVPGALVVPAGQTPCSMEAVLALLQNIRTKSVTIISQPNGTHQEVLWLDDSAGGAPTPHNDIT